MNGSFLLLAQGAADANQGPGFAFYLLPIVLTLAVFYFLIVLPERKRNREKQDLLGNLKKNDKVITVGGIHAVVANVQKDQDEVTLKIDEDKDIRIKVNRSSIAQVVTRDQAGAEKDEKK